MSSGSYYMRIQDERLQTIVFLRRDNKNFVSTSCLQIQMHDTHDNRDYQHCVRSTSAKNVVYNNQYDDGRPTDIAIYRHRKIFVYLFLICMKL